MIDRLIQQTIAQVLSRIYDPKFFEHSYGFRPSRSAHDAVRKAKGYIRDGYRWQGGPLSPLLSNIVLDKLDKEIEKRGHKFVRYADDCNIYVKSKRVGEQTMASVQRFIEGKLRLKVNEKKSAVDRPWKRKFLGFSFTPSEEPKVRIARESIKRMKKKVREITSRKDTPNGISN